METMTVANAMAWLGTWTGTHVCILSNLMSMFRKVKTDCVHRQWLMSACRSRLQCVNLIFMPGHAEIKGNKRADSLVTNKTTKQWYPELYFG